MEARPARLLRHGGRVRGAGPRDGADRRLGHPTHRVLRRPLADGAVVALAYEPNTTDFGVALQAVAQQGAKAGDTAVYLAGFEEVADVLAAAGSVQGLDQATWYGGDGSAPAKQLVDDAQP